MECALGAVELRLAVGLCADYLDCMGLKLLRQEAFEFDTHFSAFDAFSFHNNHHHHHTAVAAYAGPPTPPATAAAVSSSSSSQQNAAIASGAAGATARR